MSSLDPAGAATSGSGFPPDPDERWQLTPGEREILGRIADGYSYAEIARARGVSESTVRSLAHRARLKRSRDMPESAEGSWQLTVGSGARPSTGSPGRERWPEGSLVGSLPEAERAALLAAGTPVRFEDDQIMLVQGDTGDFLYVLTAGLVKAVVAAESGVETTLAIRSRGDLVGEFGVLDDKPRTATIRAAGEVTALRVGGAAFLAITSGSRAAQMAVTRYVMGKLRETTERRAAERVWDARERLAQVLFELGRDHVEPGPDGTIRIPLTQSDLGDLAGVAVSTAERILKDLRRQGVVSTRYREVAIKNMAYLDSIRFSP